MCLFSCFFFHCIIPIKQDEGVDESRDVDAAPPAPPNIPPPACCTRSACSTSISTTPTTTTTTTTQIPPPARIPGGNPYGNPYASQGSSGVASNRPAPPPPPVAQQLRAVVDLSVDDDDNDDEHMPQAPVLDLVTPTNHSTAGDSVSVAGRTTTMRTSQDSSSQETSGLDSLTTTMGDTEPLSFVELLEIVARLQTDRQVYRQYESKVFVVACKMIGNHQNFNIERTKKKKRDRLHKDDKVRDMLVPCVERLVIEYFYSDTVLVL